MAHPRLDWSGLLLWLDDRAARVTMFMSNLSSRERSTVVVSMLEEMERLHELLEVERLAAVELRAEMIELEVEHGNLALELEELQNETDDEDEDERMKAVEAVVHDGRTGPTALRRAVLTHVPVVLQSPPDAQVTWPAHVPRHWGADEIVRLGHDLVRAGSITTMMVRMRTHYGSANSITTN